eukprot:1877389-Alexandrium_andersonii.AAC.1
MRRRAVLIRALRACACPIPPLFIGAPPAAFPPQAARRAPCQGASASPPGRRSWPRSPWQVFAEDFEVFAKTWQA